MAHQLKTTSKV